MKKIYKTFFFVLALMIQQTSFAQGPDAFGYTYLSSDDVGGPTFSWIDITSVGTQVSGLSDDNSVAFVPMGMDFHYYWSSFDQIKIGSNGWLSFNNVSNISHCFPAIPSAGGNGDNLVCPLMGDLNFNGASNPGSVYYHNDGNGKFIVSYLNAPFWVNAVPDYVGDNTFQVIFDNADSSITFQYQMMDAALANDVAACPTDVVVGMENITGNIGLGVSQDMIPASNSAIKFIYPETVLISVDDVQPSWNQNEKNGGEFYLPYDMLEFTTNISNTGNTNNGSSTEVGIELRNEATANVAYTGSANVPNLAIGESSLVTLTDAVTDLVPGQYFLEVTTNNTSDINPTNNANTTEIGILDTNAVDLVFSYVSDITPNAQVSWASPNSGAGIFINPPQYPTSIISVEMHIQSADADEFFVEIRDDDGVDGAPGTLLATQTVPSGSYTDGTWVLVPLDSPVAINDGGFYVGYLEGNTGGTIALSAQTAGPISRRTFEVLGGAWAEYRSSTLADLYIRVQAENTYEQPVSNKNVLLNSNVSIFPNPTKDFLTIENNSDQELEEILIYNTLGEQILQKSTSIQLNGNENIQLRNVDAGIYYVKIRSGNAWMSRKIVVMR